MRCGNYSVKGDGTFSLAFCSARRRRGVALTLTGSLARCVGRDVWRFHSARLTPDAPERAKSTSYDWPTFL
jgi:hypothetical protein